MKTGAYEEIIRDMRVRKECRGTMTLISFPEFPTRDYVDVSVQTNPLLWNNEQMEDLPHAQIERIEGIYITPGIIKDQRWSLARFLNRYYKGKDDVYVIGVLTGAAMFKGDLLKKIHFDHEEANIKLSSYNEKNRRGPLDFEIDFPDDVEGRSVILIEDIADSFVSMDRIESRAQERGVKELLTVTLLDKVEGRLAQYHDRHPGISLFTIKNRYVVGYGLDANKRMRYLNGIFTIKGE
ncbi:hypothetical protein JXB02_01960 [Candidatus Woesearchaeota archaeon]|nr:hypothetical protein [Candidatus Woesearchaeota archaeon]